MRASNARLYQATKLEFDVKLVKERRGIWKFKGTASVDGEEACSAEFMCAIREIV